MPTRRPPACAVAPSREETLRAFDAIISAQAPDLALVAASRGAAARP
jgi:hypothetical protein